MKDARRSFLLEVPQEPMAAGLAFLRHARFLLLEDCSVKIHGALSPLTEQQVWSRPNDATNSIGNLALHLAGNARQWLISGVAGAPDKRDRASEFAARETMSKAELLGLLDATLAEVDAVLSKLVGDVETSASDKPLQREIRPQGYAQTVLDAIFHVTEHFSYHTGQIILLAKWQEGAAIRFYDDGDLAGRA